MIAKTRDLIPTGFLLLGLAGCGATTTMIEPTIPAPRVEKIPISVALRMPEEFESFVHEENVLGKEAWTINLGRSNASFFEQLFGHMFNDITVIGADDDARDFVFDALIEPSIDGFEFSVPNQSKTEEFAVWIRYRLRVFDRDGNNASNWTVSAYGKSRKQGFRGSDSLEQAAVLAMRDAAALIIMQMDKATNISRLGGGGLAAADTGAAATLANEAVPEKVEIDYGVFVIGGIGGDE